jgi:adenosine deaminase
MYFSPTFAMRRGVTFDTIWTGICAGMRDAERDHAIACRMILDVDKPSGPAAAAELVDLAASCDRDLLVGIGGDAGELGVDLPALAAPFATARRLGFRTTMHLGEEGPVDDIRVGVDVVGVERVDHGFSLLDDDALVRRFADERIPVTTCPTSNRCIGLIDAVADHPLLRMRDAGVLVTLNSDNAAMFRIDLADELANVRDAFGCPLDELEDFTLAGIEASWLDESTQRRYRREFGATMDRLRVERGLPQRFSAGVR